MDGSIGGRIDNQRSLAISSQQVQDCFDGPRITSIAPSVPAAAASYLYLTGANFADNMIVTVQGEICLLISSVLQKL